MTITMRTTKIVYLPDGTQTQFSVTFPVFDEGDVECIQVDGLTETLLTGFTVSDITVGNGYVTFSTPPAAGKSLVVRRRTARVQESDYPVAGRFPADIVERDFDRLTAMVQELDEQMDRAVLAPSDGRVDPGDLFDELTANVGKAQAYANAADASASTAQTAAAAAVTEATAQATAAASSATAAAHSADAAYAASEGMAPRMDAMEVVASAAKAVTDTATATPAASSIPISGGTSRLAIGWIPGLFVGDIRLIPYRAADLATYCPGWHHCNGDGYDITSNIGAALNALPAHFKTDWGITVSGTTIYIPSLYYSDGRGVFLRAVNGTSRQVGSVQNDAVQWHEHGIGLTSPAQYQAASGFSGLVLGGTSHTWGPQTASGQPTLKSDYNESRSLNAGMTPAMFLDI